MVSIFTNQCLSKINWLILLHSKYLDSITKRDGKKGLLLIKIPRQQLCRCYIILIRNKNEVPWSSIFYDKRKVRADKKTQLGHLNSLHLGQQRFYIIFKLKRIPLYQLEYDYQYFENWSMSHIKWARQSSTISSSWRPVNYVTFNSHKNNQI